MYLQTINKSHRIIYHVFRANSNNLLFRKVNLLRTSSRSRVGRAPGPPASDRIFSAALGRSEIAVLVTFRVIGWNSGPCVVPQRCTSRGLWATILSSSATAPPGAAPWDRGVLEQMVRKLLAMLLHVF